MNKLRTVFLFVLAGWLVIWAGRQPDDAVLGQTTPLRRVNAPYTTSVNGGWPKDRAIFWFGQVNPT
ncbi:MAG TPA: hypothetical protein ENJ93_04750, partial [Chloroflexi bacterium]|nr:hypothetical protein [Chloroflexota bacterium]